MTTFIENYSKLNATGWQQGFQMSGRAPLDLDSVKLTLAELQNWADKVNTTAHPGKIVSVINDGDNNGLYIIKTIKDETGQSSIIHNITNSFTLFHITSELPSVPETGDENKIHLVPIEGETSPNMFTEYIWANNKWEKLGETGISLDGYATTAQLQTLQNDINSAIEDIVDGTTPIEKANVLNTSTKIGVGEAVSSTPKVYTGKNDIVIPITTLREAYLTWGGKVISGNIGPLDCAMKEDTSKNKLSFLDPDAIDIEYSNDGGNTWLDYSNSHSWTEDEYKKIKIQIVTIGFSKQVFHGGHSKISSATTDDMLRITISSRKIINGTNINYFYFQITKILINYQSASSGRLNIEYLTNADVDNEDKILEGKEWKLLNQNTSIEVKGNSGWNSIYPYLSSYLFGGGHATSIRRIRFSFYTTNEDNYSKSIRNIYIYASNVWSDDLRYKTPLARYGHMYDYDIDGNVTFPANVTSSNITKITNDIDTLNTIISENGSDISKIKNKLFPLEVTLSVTPSGAQEYTGANKEFTISWTTKIDGESVAPTKLELTVGGTIVEIDDPTKTSVTVVADNDRIINLSVEAEGRTATKTANINFARRYYSAVVDSGWSATDDTIKALAKSALKSAAAATVTYSAATQKKIVFAYPVSHDVMSTIKDAYGNSMFTLNDSGKTFNTAPTTVAVTLSGGATLDYYVYESVITNVTAGNITYTTKSFD